MPRRPIGEQAMTATERSRRRHRLTTAKGRYAAAEHLARRMPAEHDAGGEVTVESLGELCFSLYWAGRLGAARRLAPEAGDWNDPEERAYWYAEARRFASGQELEVLPRGDEVA